MSDDTTKSGHDDRIRINLKQVFEVRHWTKAFGISRARLVESVKHAGPLVEDVRAYLLEKIKAAK